MEPEFNPCIYCGSKPKITPYKASGEGDDTKDLFTCECQNCAYSDDLYRAKVSDACGETPQDCADYWNDNHPANEVMRQIQYLMLNKNLWFLGRLVSKMRAIVNEFDVMISLSDSIPDDESIDLNGRNKIYISSKNQVESLLKDFVKDAGKILHFDTESPMENPEPNPHGGILKR